jgi:hypothetical protein
VYVGISSTDYMDDHIRPVANELNPFIMPGNVLSVAAGWGGAGALTPG